MSTHPVLDSITRVQPLPGTEAPQLPAQLTPPTIFTLDESPPPSANPYARTFRGAELDVYRILKLYGVTDPAIQHAVKKLLRYGAGGHKDRATDISEAIHSLQRWQEIESEDQNA